MDSINNHHSVSAPPLVQTTHYYLSTSRRLSSLKEEAAALGLRPTGHKGRKSTYISAIRAHRQQATPVARK